MKKMILILGMAVLVLLLPSLNALENVSMGRSSFTLVAPDDLVGAAALEDLDGATFFIEHQGTEVTGKITNNFAHSLEIFLGIDPEVTESVWHHRTGDRDEDWELSFHLGGEELLYEGTGSENKPRGLIGPVFIGPGETRELAVYFEIHNRARNNYSFFGLAYFDLAGYTETGEEVFNLAHDFVPRYQYYESWR